MGGVEFNVFVYLIYLFCDGLVCNFVIVVYDQAVVYVSGVVSYVFGTKYVLYKYFRNVE